MWWNMKNGEDDEFKNYLTSEMIAFWNLIFGSNMLFKVNIWDVALGKIVPDNIHLDIYFENMWGKI